ncbi:MAG: RAMP superfamily CRISPR-associated protein [Desulfococcaceae bacterium]
MTEYLWYKLTLRSPAIVSGVSNDPNSAATLSFIPGSAIRGALAGRLLADKVDPEGEEFRQLILSGAVRFLHAYPEIGGERSLPAPVSLRSEKNEPKNGCDLADYDGDPSEAEDMEDLEEHWPAEDLASAGAPFLSPAAFFRAVPDVRARLHQQRDRNKGRPWKDRRNGAEINHGAIFAYEYLEAGQTFCGAIQLRPEAANARERIKTLLKKAPILVGRSRRAGYGGEADICFEPEPIGRENGSVSSELRRGLSPGDEFRLRTLSACVIRDPDTGQLDPAALEFAVLKRLGDRAEVLRRRWNFERVGGFNRKWRLETPQALSAAAGSVLVLRAKSEISADDLRKIEHDGIGERKAEGFGRVIFLDQPEEPASIYFEEKDDKKPNASPETAPASETLNFLETRLILSAARAELDVAAAELAGKAQKIPSNSLIGRLRGLLRNAPDAGAALAALGHLNTWCGGGDNGLKCTAEEQLKKCRIANMRLLDWLRATTSIHPDGDGWKTLSQRSGSEAALNGVAERYRLNEKKAAENILVQNAPLLSVYLVDAVLAAMARKNRGGA